uniref:Reverse transcriptase zinc-binding domain-containing protein n=1 Tax=Anopheles maculatus TaxID=74869 RepID=A0A182SMK9_9DIPT
MAERMVSLHQWQQEWQESAHSAWTRLLIPEVTSWTSCRFGEVEFFTTQLMAGHGFFQDHLERMNFIQEAHCPECWELRETPEHVILECPRFIAGRRRMNCQVREEVTVANIIALMCSSRNIWCAIAETIGVILTRLQQRRIRIDRATVMISVEDQATTICSRSPLETGRVISSSVTNGDREAKTPDNPHQVFTARRSDELSMTKIAYTIHFQCYTPVGDLRMFGERLEEVLVGRIRQYPIGGPMP